jgi:hypothetical protein
VPPCPAFAISPTARCWTRRSHLPMRRFRLWRSAVLRRRGARQSAALPAAGFRACLHRQFLGFRRLALAVPHRGIEAFVVLCASVSAWVPRSAIWPSLQHDDLVGVGDHRRQPVGDDQRGAVLETSRVRPGFPARCGCRAPRSPRRGSGSAGFSKRCGRSPRAASRRPTASARARRPSPCSLRATLDEAADLGDVGGSLDLLLAAQKCGHSGCCRRWCR